MAKKMKMGGKDMMGNGGMAGTGWGPTEGKSVTMGESLTKWGDVGSKPGYEPDYDAWPADFAVDKGNAGNGV